MNHISFSTQGSTRGFLAGFQLLLWALSFCNSRVVKTLLRSPGLRVSRLCWGCHITATAAAWLITSLTSSENEDNVRRKLKRRSLSLCPRKRAPLEELTDSVKRPREILSFVWVIRQGTGSANSKTEWLVTMCQSQNTSEDLLHDSKAFSETWFSWVLMTHCG